MHKVFVYCFLFCFSLLLLSCQSRPDYLIDEETMTDLLTDVHMSEGLLDMQQKVSKDDPEYGKEVMASVLMKYHVSKADYDSSLVWYSQHLNTFIRIYKHVNKNLKENEEQWTTLAEASNEFGKSQSGDSVDLWCHASYLLMDEVRLSHFRAWTFTADTAYHKGDTIRWQIHVPALPEDEHLVASLAMLEQTESTSSIQILDGASTTWIAGDTLLTLSCVCPPDKEISQVVATLHLMQNDSSTTVLRPCVLDCLSLIRLHRR